MKLSVFKSLYWAPRILCMAFVIFLSLFALDVFQEGRGFWETAEALAIHLIPSAVLLVILVLAWKWEWIGTLLFASGAILYAVSNLRHWSWVLVISGPMLVIAALFLLSWLKRRVEV